MHLILLPLRRRATTALVLFLAVACSSGTSPTTVPTTSPTTVAAGPTPPVGAPGCPLGYGSGKFSCQGDMPGLLPQLDAAIDTLVAQKPQIFNLNDAQPGGAYRIKDVDAFYAGVIANLQAAGLCSQPSYGRDSLWIKENNSYSENYNVVTPRDYMERGPRSYNVTCTPANFPLTPEEAVRLVNVSFFRITNCPAGVTPLPPAFNQLPVGCVGTITATPKDAVGNKLPLDLHGADVKWFFEAGEGDIVAASPDQATPFNVRLYARTAGNFRICATVQTRTGCLNGTVTP